MAFNSALSLSFAGGRDGDEKPFGQALRLARLKKGLLQENFETVSSRQTVSFLERGKSSVTL
ncbi:XRE family transcriptional regulator, partial [Pseudomonas sp. ATCC 13867]